jgi:hypothetical protein
MEHLQKESARILELKLMNQLNLFDLPTALEQRDKGILAAAEGKPRLIVEARSIALEYAARHGTVTADDVQRVWVERGGGVHDLGNATGAIFRDERFEFTGRYIKSVRIHGHGNLLRIWKLKV